MNITLVAKSSYRHPRDIDQKVFRRQIKQQFGVEVRRLDSFTLCGLGAVAAFADSFTEIDNLSLIGCAQYFSVELVQQMIIDIEQGRSLKPLDFVSTVGNAANFYIAKQFSIFGSNLFVGADELSLEKTFLLAALELSSNPIQSIILLLWQENELERICRAFLVRASIPSDEQFAQVNQISDLGSAIDINIPLRLNLSNQKPIF